MSRVCGERQALLLEISSERPLAMWKFATKRTDCMFEHRSAVWAAESLCLMIARYFSIRHIFLVHYLLRCILMFCNFLVL